MGFLQTVMVYLAIGVAAFVVPLFIMMFFSGPAVIREAKARQDYYRRKEGAPPLNS